MSYSGTCSNSRRLRFRACRSLSHWATDCPACGAAMIGKVLMNSPNCCSMPGSGAERPAIVAPNATQDWPV
ncbi:hypothetical protein D3C72_1519540 [compost metagenome]